MKPSHHALASAVTSAAFYAVTESTSGTIICFLSGIFIDIDHFFDFWAYKKKLFFTSRELFDYCEKERGGKLTLVFHSYEGWIIFWWALVQFNLGPFWWGLAIGCTTHLALDQWVNPLRLPAYFFVYRWRRGFLKEFLVTPEEFARLQ